MTELSPDAERWKAREEERRTRVRAAKVVSVKRALSAASWAALVADPLTPDRLIDALEDEGWQRGCRCYPLTEDEVS